jgi:hypothetical protein
MGAQIEDEKKRDEFQKNNRDKLPEGEFAKIILNLF